MISYFLQACLISSYLPTVAGIRLYTGKTGKILIAQLNKFGTVSHTQFLLFFTHRSLLVWVSVRQLDGLLPVKLHVRTGGGRTLLPNIALHSGDSLLLFFFFSVHSCSVVSNDSCRLHFNPRTFFPLFSSLLCFVPKCSEPCVILHSWQHKVHFHSHSSCDRATIPTCFCKLAFFFIFFFCENAPACKDELAWLLRRLLFGALKTFWEVELFIYGLPRMWGNKWY